MTNQSFPKTLSGVPVHDGARFQWSNGHGHVEASSLRQEQHSRLWSDSSDVGFYVRSHRTGAVELFVFDHEVVNEGDVFARVYKVHRAKASWTVTVFND